MSAPADLHRSGTGATGGIRRFFFPALPIARLAVLARVAYVFVLIDVLFLHTSGHYHGWTDPVWYEPLALGKILQLPAASVPLVETLRWTCVVAAAVAAAGRFPRVAGWLVAIAWTWYQYVAFSYGKVDHDRADFVLALFLLPTVVAAATTDRRRSEAAGFALRAIQLVAIATYFMSAFAKLRFGGPEWVNSATMARAVVRRGTWIGEQFLAFPWTLHAFQWVLMSAELLSPVIFLLSERWQRRMVYCWYLFHATVYATITIAFWPHLVMMLAFLPLEQYRDAVVRAWRSRFGRRPVTMPRASGP